MSIKTGWFPKKTSYGKGQVMLEFFNGVRLETRNTLKGMALVLVILLLKGFTRSETTKSGEFVQFEYRQFGVCLESDK